MTAAGTGLIAATATVPARGEARGRPEAADGTPEQVHLTWGDDPTQTVVVSWASPGQAARPRVRIGQRVVTAAERAYTDSLSGAVTWTYHARVDGLRPGATYGYAVTADNDANAADPFSATFTTAVLGRAAFRFTCFGDLATPKPAGAGSRVPSPADLPRGARGAAPPEDNRQAAYAVGAVETFQPLFHLLNGDLANAAVNPAALNPVARWEAWRDFGNNVQASAANRPWLPVPGDHELEAGTGGQGLDSFLARYALPSNGADGFEGRWYAFRVGTALFVCLSGDDVACSGAGAFVADPAPLYVRGYSGGAQTRWLESTLAAARADASLDWIVASVHQCACSSAPDGTGSDLGIRREWLPLFDAFEVDLVLSGHGHGYERSFPVRGADAGAGTDALTGAAADTRRPRPVTTVDSGVFDTSQGTVHLVLGCGGDADGPGGGPDTASPRLARVITRPGAPMPDARVPRGYLRPEAEAVEAATWSARRDTAAGYGIAVFDVNPGSEAGGQTSITVRYYHTVGAEPVGPAAGASGGSADTPADDYALFETFTLVRPRSDGRRWHLKG
jgi:Purple acid Phosphatase, N-terminal domain/Calcineurin-like phosphoesterase